MHKSKLKKAKQSLFLFQLLANFLHEEGIFSNSFRSIPFIESWSFSFYSLLSFFINKEKEKPKIEIYIDEMCRGGISPPPQDSLKYPIGREGRLEWNEYIYSLS